MEPNQFLHEALGFIAFIVPAALIALAVVIGLTVAGFVVFIVLVARENRRERKAIERRKAERLKLDAQRLARRSGVNK